MKHGRIGLQYRQFFNLYRAVSGKPAPIIAKEAIATKTKKLKANFSHAGYLEAVAKAREYICAGDIFQVNLSQRLEVDINISPYELYKRLRKINPAPFANYFNFDGVSIVGASPERFLKVRGDWVETRPIKGHQAARQDAQRG